MMFKGYIVLDPAKESNGTTYPAHLTVIVESVEYAVSSGSKTESNSNNSTNTTSSVARQSDTKKHPKSPF